MAGRQDVRPITMRGVKYLAAVIGGGVAVYLMVCLGVFGNGGSIAGTTQDSASALPSYLRFVTHSLSGAGQKTAFSFPTYLSFVSVMLTAVTVMLAAVAIGVGVVAAYTFQQLERRAEMAAEKKVEALVAELLSEEEIQRRINEIAFATGSEEWVDSEQNPEQEQ